MTCPYKEQKRIYVKTEADWSDAGTRKAISHQKLEEARKYSPLEPTRYSLADTLISDFCLLEL